MKILRIFFKVKDIAVFCQKEVNDSFEKDLQELAFSNFLLKEHSFVKIHEGVHKGNFVKTFFMEVDNLEKIENSLIIPWNDIDFIENIGHYKDMFQAYKIFLGDKTVVGSSRSVYGTDNFFSVSMIETSNRIDRIIREREEA